MGIAHSSRRWPLRGRRDNEQRLDAELRFHFDALVDENVRAGMSRKEAHRRASIEFGGLAQLKEECRDERAYSGWEEALRDVQIAWRGLRKSAGFTAIVVCVLGLCIGANIGVFTVVNEVLLNPQGVQSPNRIVSLNLRFTKRGVNNLAVAAPDFVDLARNTELFESVALVTRNEFNYLTEGFSQRLIGSSISARWFEVFGAKPILGRTFQAEEDQPLTNHVVILSFDTWKRWFGEDPSVIGKTLDLDRIPHRVVGVMGPEFQWPLHSDIWVPLGANPEQFTEEHRLNDQRYSVVARLKDGISFARASAFVELVNERVRSDSHSGNQARDSGWGLYLVPLTDSIAGNLKIPVLILFGSAGLVLVITCANVAGLMLARCSARSRDWAIRAALGASGIRLVRPILAEAALLSFGGTVMGLVVAKACLSLLPLVAPEEAPIRIDFHLGALALMFALLAAAGGVSLFGGVPAWHIAKWGRGIASYHALLKDGGRTMTGGLTKARARSVLVVFESALALVLVVGAGLLLRSMIRIQSVNPGFAAKGVVTMDLTLPETGYREAPKRLVFQRTVIDAAAKIPNLANVATAFPEPFSRAVFWAPFHIQGRAEGSGEVLPEGNVSFASPNYFTTMQIPLIAGRLFSDDDRADTPLVVLIDQTLAKKYWPNENPVGQHIRQSDRAPWAMVIGVVGRVKLNDLAENGEGVFYYCAFQRSTRWITLVARAGPRSSGEGESLRQAIAGIDSSLAVSRMRSLQELLDASLAPRRFVTILLGCFAALAVLIAGLGLYGIISYSVAQRTQEFGIRLSIGAQPREVLLMVMGCGLRLWSIGAVAGLVLAYAMGRLIQSQLFQISAFDSYAVFGAGIMLGGVALLACYLPARRATKIDPVEALRWE